MSRKRLDWDRAKWDTLRAKCGPPSVAEEIDAHEEAKLQAWWDGEKSDIVTPLQQLPRKKRHKVKRADRIAKAIAREQRKESGATHAERLARWKARRETLGETDAKS